MKVVDYIYKKNILPKEFCKEVLKEIKNKDWQKHKWYDPNTGSMQSEETKELDVLSITQELQQKFIPFMFQITKEYNEKFAITENRKTSQLVHKFTPIRFNKYSKGTVMREHYDHIHSIHCPSAPVAVCCLLNPGLNCIFCNGIRYPYTTRFVDLHYFSEWW